MESTHVGTSLLKPALQKSKIYFEKITLEVSDRPGPWNRVFAARNQYEKQVIVRKLNNKEFSSIFCQIFAVIFYDFSKFRSAFGLLQYEES